MKIISLTAFLFIGFFLLTACNNHQVSIPATFDPDHAQTGKLEDGEHPVYYKNGKIKYRVEYKNGKPNGQVKQYYEDGKLYMEATFKDGRRNGKCTYFFKNGKPFSAYTYVNGLREGDAKKYWEGGELLSVCPFKNDNIQPGLKEYRKDGTLIENNVSLIITEVDRIVLEQKYYLKISLSDPKIKAKYYVSVLSEKKPRGRLPMSGNTGIYNVPVEGSGFIMKKLVFDAEYETRHGNIMRLQKTFSLAIN